VVHLETTTTATTLAASAIGWYRCDVLNATNAHTRTSKGTQSSLTTWTWSLGTVTAHSANLDVQGSDTELLAAGGNILSSQHSSVWGRLVTICLDLHTACTKQCMIEVIPDIVRTNRLFQS
jgi:hypothetical protein